MFRHVSPVLLPPALAGLGVVLLVRAQVAGAHRATRLDLSQFSGVWSMWCTVSVLRCVSSGSPGLRHCFPHSSHFHPASSFTWAAICFQSFG